MAFQSRPEPMNASPYHSKVKVSLTLSDSIYVAGGNVSGKMEVECRADADSGLGIGVIMVELFAIQEITSRDHSATSTFIHARRLFQGPGLPPSNAVHPDYVPSPGEPPLPAHHHAARRGLTTFFFRFPLHPSSPSSISFGPARIRYQVRASVGVALREERRLVTDNREVSIVELGDDSSYAQPPQGIAVAEGGDIWARAVVVNGGVVAGESACVELQLKNHSKKWTSGVSLTVTRNLHLSQPPSSKPPLDISDTITHVDFRGPEYAVPPGIEGVATLVVDIPRHARTARGGPRFGEDGKMADGLFEVRCVLSIRVELSLGSDDVCIHIPVNIQHPLAAPSVVSPQPFVSLPQTYATPLPHQYALSPPPVAPYAGLSTASPTSHCLNPFTTGIQWSPPVQPESPYFSPTFAEPYPQHFSPPSQQLVPHALLPPRPVSAEPHPPVPYYDHFLPPVFPSSGPPIPLSAYSPDVQFAERGPVSSVEVHEGKGARASRISQTLCRSARHRSVSPRPHGYPLPVTPQQALPTTPRARPTAIDIPTLPNPHDTQGVLHSPRPVPSPKQSYKGLTPRSENVCTLEQMADEDEKKNSDPRRDILESGTAEALRKESSTERALETDLAVNKTLPRPPVPTGKERLELPGRPKADTYFVTPVQGLAEPAGDVDVIPQAPPTPPHAAITPVKFPRALTEMSGLSTILPKDLPKESGLDALERRLLAEVGTRRQEHEVRPDVRSVIQPITIPASGAPEGVNDSAISSLTLADGFGKENSWQREQEQEQDRDSDERTHYPGGRQGQSDDDRDVHTQNGRLTREQGTEKDGDSGGNSGQRRGRKKNKDSDVRKLRGEAKGRIAAWLGNIDTAIPPAVDDPSSVASPAASHFVPIAEHEPFEPPVQMEDPPIRERDQGMSLNKGDVSAAPNPRSSGFVTIVRGSVPISDNSPTQSPSAEKRRAVESRQHGPTDSSAKQGPLLTQPGRVDLLPQPPANKATSNQRAMDPLPGPVLPKPNRLAPPGFLRSSPVPLDPEVKYDIRSARGGRGGKVTEVASLWASKASPVDPPAKAAQRTTAPIPPARKLVDAKNAEGIEKQTKPTKASTVPAVISSSHAVPMLSSTASLARVSPGVNRTRLAPSLSPTIESVPETKVFTKSPGSQPVRTPGDLAFGQARLRDLIKKYQGF
ncbi:hypothetical protein BV22DRAFT_1063091 [Leucogyrophana mollusca]|uniref:Uncharacterized protein n=1 Tax=Leucogyrophana mollusca TaxID=85980 RepID=A0ACB8BM16_9AGAM|nr:hypothetical protein BV22DRAFT_1063091 [Leucogyrophana mollusca]